MVKFDSITVGVIVATLCFLVVSLLVLVGWLYRVNQKIIKEKLDETTLTARKADVKTSTNEANIKSNKDTFEKALEVARLEGEVAALKGLVIGFQTEMVRQCKDYALGQVRREMSRAIFQEVTAQLKPVKRHPTPPPRGNPSGEVAADVERFHGLGGDNDGKERS